MPHTVFQIDDESFHADPIPTLRAMREAGPIVSIKIPIFGTVQALTRYDDIDEFLCDTKRFARDGRTVGKKSTAGMRWWMPKILRSFAENMLAYDGEDHRRLRSLVDQAFFKRNVDSMRDEIFRIADAMLDGLERQRGTASDVDLISGFARQFPLAVICELLGLPDGDRPKFTKWFEPFGNIRSFWSLPRMVPGLLRLRTYLKEQFREARRAPGTGLISELVAAEQEGGRLTEDELLAMTFLLLVAGHETTTHLIGDGVLALLDHPDQRQRLVEDWSLASTAVDEILRYTSPVQMSKPRFVTEDMNLHGTQLSRGSMLIGILASANFDPDQFTAPEDFDIARSPNRHLSFGAGIHVCLGLKLAKMEAAIAYERIWTRYPRLRLAVERNQVRWKSRIGIRCLQSLPVVLNEEVDQVAPAV